MELTELQSKRWLPAFGRAHPSMQWSDRDTILPAILFGYHVAWRPRSQRCYGYSSRLLTVGNNVEARTPESGRILPDPRTVRDKIRCQSSPAEREPSQTSPSPLAPLRVLYGRNDTVQVVGSWNPALLQDTMGGTPRIANLASPPLPAEVTSSKITCSVQTHEPTCQWVPLRILVSWRTPLHSRCPCRLLLAPPSFLLLKGRDALPGPQAKDRMCIPVLLANFRLTLK